MAMEPEEIAVVLARASLLHSKLDDAIALLLLQPPPPPLPLPEAPDSPPPHDVHSLVHIRDALQSLQDHLSSLQALQLQQRADRDARLAEIEESRRVFLKRLKDHTGRELEIIQEALTFAGGNAPEKTDVFADNFSEEDLQNLASGQKYVHANGLSGNHEQQQRKIGIYDLDIEDAEGGSDDDLIVQRTDHNGVKKLLGIAMMNAVSTIRRSLQESHAIASAMRYLRNSLVLLGQFARRVKGQLQGSTSKIAFVMATTILFVSLSESAAAKRRSSVSGDSKRVNQTPHSPPKSFHGKYRRHNVKKLLEASKTGSLSSDESTEKNQCLPNCFIQERTELPFYKESEAPDVLYGRG